MSEGKKEVERKRTRLLRFIDKASLKRLFSFWILTVFLFGAAYFCLSSFMGIPLDDSGMPISANVMGGLKSLYFSFETATLTLPGGIPDEEHILKILSSFEIIISFLLYAFMIARLINVKQEVILEEVYNLNYEELIDRLRSGLYLFRSDVNKIIEKAESNTLTHRELKDIWVVFSSLDTSLTNIKNFILPDNSESDYQKKLDLFRLELLLNSIKLSMSKMLELIKSLKAHAHNWRNELLLTSVYYDVKVVEDIVNFQFKRSGDKKVIERLHEIKIILDEIEIELKTSVIEKPAEQIFAQQDVNPEAQQHQFPEQPQPAHHPAKKVPDALKETETSLQQYDSKDNHPDHEQQQP